MGLDDARGDDPDPAHVGPVLSEDLPDQVPSGRGEAVEDDGGAVAGPGLDAP